MTKNPDGTVEFDNYDEIPADVPVVHAADIMDALIGLDEHDGLLEALSESNFALEVSDERDMLAYILLQEVAPGMLAPWDPTA